MKFELTQPAFIQLGLREKGAIVDLDCQKVDKAPTDKKTPFVVLGAGSEGEAIFVGRELPPRSAKPYAGDKPAEGKGLPKEPPRKNP